MRQRAANALFLAIALLVPARANSQSGAAEEILKQAISRHQAGEIDGAIQAYEKYLAARPDSAMARSNLGAAYARAARYEDAIAQYRHALKLQPANAPVELNLALAYYKTGRKELAAGILEKVHRAAPDELQPTLLLADCWLAIGMNKNVAELLTPLSDKKPDDLAVAYLLGTALIRDNQVPRGQVVIDRILRNGDSAEARLLLGTTKLNAQDYPAALADLSKAVELNANLPDVYSFYGQALLATGTRPAPRRRFARRSLARALPKQDIDLALKWKKRRRPMKKKKAWVQRSIAGCARKASTKKSTQPPSSVSSRARIVPGAR